jgi:hypothetical protein
MNCSVNFMAKNIIALKTLQENRSGAPIAHRQPAPPQGSALYLMKMRSHGLKISASRQRLHVTIERDPKAETPQPIKITHAG